jgi:hypothetical protein
MGRISIRTGTYMFICFVAFFLFMFGIGQGYHKELRITNAIILLFFMYRDIKAYYLKNPDHKDDYFAGVVQGMGAAVIGVGGFTVFMTLFFYFNPAFMEVIKQNTVVAPYLNPFTASLFILVEGVVVALIGSYVLTRIILRDND